MQPQTERPAHVPSVAALLKFGNDLMDRGEVAETIAAYRSLTMLAPQFSPGYRSLALALEQGGELGGALSASARAIELQGDDLDAYLIMARLLLKLERMEQAVAMYELAALAAPARSDIQASLAAALARQGRLDEASAACRKAIALSPQNVGAWLNLGIISSKRGDLDGAVEAYRQAVSIDPNSPEAFTNLGAALGSLGRSAAAIEASARAVALRPLDAELHYNHAMLLLRAGDLKAGFCEFEWRLSHASPKFRPRSFDVPRWHGEFRDGRTLLIHAEQGLGDSLHFVRFVTQAATGGPVVLQVQPPLVELLRDSLEVTVISRDEPVPRFDLHVPLMSLPFELGTTMETIPAQMPYLKASPAKAVEWREALTGYPGLRVGVVWAGSPGHRHDHLRSLSPELLLPRLVMPGVQLFSLQKEPRADDRILLERLNGEIVDLAPSLASLADTAAAVSAMDLVISVDTAVAHLAGALGKPTWILLPHVLDWRWLYAREDTPWYPTARLFRQARSGDWTSVLDRLPLELARFAAQTCAHRAAAV